ncbi:reverse transcriptase domain-containing protein [Tanacetum coccineum]
MVSKFLSKYYPYSKALQLRKDILNFQQLPTETVFEAWERFKSCLRKCPDHRILLVHQILTFYHGITIIDRDKIMVAAGGNVMRKTPQEAYDLIENMTQHHYQWDFEVQYDTTTDMSAHYSKTTFASGEQVKSDEDEPLEIDKSEIDQLIRESSYAFLMGDEELELYSHEDHFHEELKSIHPLSVRPTPSSDPILLPHLLPPSGIVTLSWKRLTPFLLLIRYHLILIIEYMIQREISFFLKN